MPIASIENDHEIIKRTYEIWQDVTYKPSVCNINVSMTFNCLEVIIRYKVICSRTGKDIIQSFYQGFTVYDFRYCETPEQYLEQLHAFIQKIERHEVSENFKYKGEMIFDPHITPGDGRF